MKCILHTRTYNTLSTTGQVFLPNGEIFKTLEDVGRPTGVKIPGDTCIPEGAYQVELTHSNRFGKKLPIIGNARKNGQLVVNRGGVYFTGIRIHGGNTVEDTEGCPLVAVEHKDDRIWNCTPAVNAIVQFLEKETQPVYWVITREMTSI